MIPRIVASAVLLIVGAYVTYAVAAGYVGGLPTPANFAAALALIAILCVTVPRVLRPARRGMTGGPRTRVRGVGGSVCP